MALKTRKRDAFLGEARCLARLLPRLPRRQVQRRVASAPQVQPQGDSAAAPKELVSKAGVRAPTWATESQRWLASEMGKPIQVI